MRSSLEQFERISDYVSGSMSDAERSLFELDLKNDPDLQQQVDFQKDMVRIVERKALRAEIGAVAAQYAAAGGMSLLTKFLLSTGVVATIAVVTFFLLNKTAVKPVPQQHAQVAQNAQETDEENEQVQEEKNTVQPVSADRTIRKPKPTPITDWVFRSGNSSNLPYVIADPIQPNVKQVPPFYSIPEDSIMRAMVNDQVQEETKRKKSTYTASWSISSLKRSVFKRSTEGQKAALRSTAVVKIADLEGSLINGAKMTYTLFGETKTVEVNGTYAFKLYQDVRTNVVVDFGDNERVILESVEFSPRRTTFLQIETVISDTPKLKLEQHD